MHAGGFGSGRRRTPDRNRLVCRHTMTIDRLEDFHVFVTVAERGSFSAAARVLRLSPSTVSKLVARMEKRFGVRVFDRTSKATTLTREGEIYLEEIRRVIDAVADVDALSDTLTRVPHGTVRVHTMPSFARHQLVPVLPEFMARYPDLRLEFRIGPRFITLTDDMDLAILFGSLADSSLVARKIAVSRRILCASPAYLEQNGTPADPSQLAGHELLGYSIPGRESWSFVDGGKAREIRMQARVTADQADLLLQLAIAGVGIARLPEFQLMGDLAAGTLVPLLVQYSVPEPINAIYRTRRNLSPRVRTFIDFIAERFREAPWNLDGRRGGR